MAEGPRVDFVMIDNVTWHAFLPAFDDGLVNVAGVNVVITGNFAGGPKSLTANTLAWLPHEVLQSGDDDGKPKLFVRYMSDTLEDPNGMLALIAVPGADAIPRFNIPSAPQQVTDGIPQWASIATRVRA
jgi:hypothetical protein